MPRLRLMSRLPSLAVCIAILAASACSLGGEEKAGSVLPRRGFADVVKAASPAVVFIQVEKVIELGQPGRGQPFNDPFDLFGDEFFERFFGPRFRRPQPSPRPQPRQRRQQGQGTGFIVRDDGYILTNNHVVGDADSIRVRLQDGREFEAERVGTDPRTEIALIKIPAKELPTVKLGDVSKLDIGEWVVAIGNPFGLSETVTAGVVSAKGRSGMGIADYEDFIQTDAAINPGNSGGPLLNMDGEVVGINTAIYSRSGGYMGIGFAIPIDMAVQIMDQLIADGRVTRGYLGVMLNPRDLDEDMARGFGLDQAAGVLIAEVMPETPAAEAGLEAGDIIVDLDGRPVTDNNTFRRDMAAIRPGARITLGIFRQGSRIEVPVEIKAFPDDKEEEEVEAMEPEEETYQRIGLTARALDRELADRLGYQMSSGVVVSEVKPGGPADRAGIRQGMLIMEVDRQEVKTVEDFKTAVAGAGKQTLLRVMNPEGRAWFVMLRNLEDEE